MQESDKINSGALFRNDRQGEGQNRPQYTGVCDIGGKKYYMSAWINESQRTGQKYFSIKFTERVELPKEENRS